MAAQKRIYLVGYGDQTRLVRAAHPAQALAHVAKGVMLVKVPTPDELISAVQKGAGVEELRDAEAKEMFEEQTEGQTA